MRRFVLRALLIAGVVTGCDAYSTSPPAFTVSLEASALTASRGDSITFTVTAQGGSLIGIDLAYGDGNADQYGTGGARTARVTFKHAFETAGTYSVRAAVTDAIKGQKDASLEVRIN